MFWLILVSGSLLLGCFLVHGVEHEAQQNGSAAFQEGVHAAREVGSSEEQSR